MPVWFHLYWNSVSFNVHVKYWVPCFTYVKCFLPCIAWWNTIAVNSSHNQHITFVNFLGELARKWSCLSEAYMNRYDTQIVTDNSFASYHKPELSQIEVACSMDMESFIWHFRMWNALKISCFPEHVILKLVPINSRVSSLFSQRHLCYCCQMTLSLVSACAVCNSHVHFCCICSPVL